MPEVTAEDFEETEAAVAEGRKQAVIEAQRREIRSLKREVSEIDAARTKLLKELDLRDDIGRARIKPPKWLVPKSTTKRNTATVVAMLSDTHFDEVVDPAAIGFCNAYDRRIAEIRLRRFFDALISLPRDYIGNLNYDGVVLMLNGDIVSGIIHDEITETNEDTMAGTVVHWSEQLHAGIAMLAEAYGNVFVACEPGNHGRNSRKIKHKLHNRDNWDWLIYKWLERDFANDPRVTIVVPESPDYRFDVHSLRILQTHGHLGFSGGNGIAGIFSPIMRGNHKASRQKLSLGQPYDLLCIGHFHQYISTSGLIVNGSLKGYDEYAFDLKFEYEPARQAMFVVTPEHGVSFTAPIIVQDRAKEGW